MKNMNVYDTSDKLEAFKSKGYEQLDELTLALIVYQNAIKSNDGRREYNSEVALKQCIDEAVSLRDKTKNDPQRSEIVAPLAELSYTAWVTIGERLNGPMSTW